MSLKKTEKILRDFSEATKSMLENCGDDFELLFEVDKGMSSVLSIIKEILDDTVTRMLQEDLLPDEQKKNWEEYTKLLKGQTLLLKQSLNAELARYALYDDVLH